MPKNNLKSQLLKFAPVFAFLGYGSWALLVNYMAESDKFITSGLIQGGFAFIATFFVRIFSIKLHQLFIDFKYTKLMTFLVVLTVMTLIPTILHLVNGTEKIFYSVLPGMIMGGIYQIIILKIEIPKG